jgi:hypothetical protein
MVQGIASNSRRCDGDSNVNVESESHLGKHVSPTNSTDDGNQTDFNEQQKLNARSSIRTTSESTVNGQFARCMQFAKQATPIVLTVDGRMTDSRERQKQKA